MGGSGSELNVCVRYILDGNILPWGKETVPAVALAKPRFNCFAFSARDSTLIAFVVCAKSHQRTLFEYDVGVRLYHMGTC